MKKHLFLLVMLSACCLPGFAQTTSSQTKTATFLNNLNNFRAAFGTLNFSARASNLAADDDVFGCSKRLRATSNSPTSTLSLQGFGFTIPDGATIQSITIRVRRFKNGSPSIGDQSLSLMQRFDCSDGATCRYGVHWTSQDDYPGKVYPDTETEYTFSQSGSGNNGGVNHNEAYEWAPAIVNHEYFGVRIDSYAPIGSGFVSICYDLVEVTVQYTSPAVTRRVAGTTETTPLKEPIVYPNPFTTKTNIRFTAAETGSAVVELYNISGAKVQTLFSGNVYRGQEYNVRIGEAQLPKGIYIYMISNNKRKYNGRITKLE